MKTLLLSALMALLFPVVAASCGRGEEPAAPTAAAREAEALAARFGQPVAIQIRAKGEVPAFTVALATSRGASVDSVVEPLTGVLFQAVGACPDFIREASLGRDTVVTFSVADGTLQSAPAEGAIEAERCLSSKLSGAAVRTPPGMSFDVMARFLFDTAAPAAEAAGGG